MGRANGEHANGDALDADGIGGYRRGGNDGSANDKRAKQRQQLQAAVAELKSSEGWLRWLKVRSRFRHYSINNQLLISAQSPNATDVMGYKSWPKLGRHVKKGEKGILIFGPPVSGTKEREKADGSKELVDYFFWPTVHVFDVAQTDGEPLPENPVRKLTGDSHASYLDKLTAYAETLGYSVSEVPLSSFRAINSGGGGLGGYCDPENKQIVLNADLDANAKVKTAIHEIAHALGVDYTDYTRAQAEVMVESVAYLVGQTIGLDTSSYSKGYVAGWDDTQTVEALTKFAETVDELAAKIETGIGQDAKEARQQLNEKRATDGAKTKEALQAINSAAAHMLRPHPAPTVAAMAEEA